MAFDNKLKNQNYSTTNVLKSHNFSGVEILSLCVQFFLMNIITSHIR